MSVEEGAGATDESWVAAADRALFNAADRIRLIRAVTPRNAEAELALFERSLRRGSPRAPRWEYRPCTVPVEMGPALSKLADHLKDRSRLGAIYAARARELALEADIVRAVGTDALRGASERRFLGITPEDREDRRRADELAAAWCAAPWDDGAKTPPRWPAEETVVASAALGGSYPGEELVKSCDESHPASLVSTMSREAGREHLAVKIVVEPGLASLAATGDGVIFVAAGKWLGRRDVERTVLHEIAGHALPRARACSAPLGIFALGTARGIDDQEGRALLIERGAGFLDGARRRELALRHVAASDTLAGADLVEIVRRLVELGAPIDAAARIATRAQRGGRGAGGLAREIVYLPALLRVERAMSGPSASAIEAMMAGGRIAADVATWVAEAVRRHHENRGKGAYQFM